MNQDIKHLIFFLKKRSFYKKTHNRIIIIKKEKKIQFFESVSKVLFFFSSFLLSIFLTQTVENLDKDYILLWFVECWNGLFNVRHFL